MTWNGQLFANAAVTNLEDLQNTEFMELAGMALRQNPKRSQLIVSTILGKHIPNNGHMASMVYNLLGYKAMDFIEHNVEPKGNSPIAVIGFAETATLMGFAVAESISNSYYIHSTRHEAGSLNEWLTFEEAHSHATSHRVIPENTRELHKAQAVVLVDDELSTGNTAMNTIDAILEKNLEGVNTFVVATILDLRTQEHKDRMEAWAQERGINFTVVSIIATEVQVDQTAPALEDLKKRAVTLDIKEDAPVTPIITKPIPATRYGVNENQREMIIETALDATRKIAFNARDRVLVLGTEEFMTPAYLMTVILNQDRNVDVHFSSTTRSPAYVINDEGYALKNGIKFHAQDGTERYAYNVLDYDTVIIVTNEQNDSLTGQFIHHGVKTHVVLIPELPHAISAETGFGSYASQDVMWLLKDLSEAELEAPVEEREEAIQNAKGHYAESLPIEYVPSDEYQELFHQTLTSEARNMASLVRTVSSSIEQENVKFGKDELVLVSLARAGTPVGALIKRHIEESNGSEVHHYAMSIVRGKGIDKNALRYIQAKHPNAILFFIDGWTGKGAITLELHAAMQEYAQTSNDRHLEYRLCVLADPGECADIYGTRKDVVIPSAFLNSTVSGLVSRTVLNDDYIGEHDFHGAKFYKDFIPNDVSNLFLDTITGENDNAVLNPYNEDLNLRETYRGMKRVEDIAEEFGIPTTTLVKPGVGETTRVLLRRKPWKILVNPEYPEEMLAHIRVLAAERGVPLVEYPNIPYSCIGIINPESKSATGDDGKAL